MSDENKLKWHYQSVPLSQIEGWDRNPVQLSEKEAERLKESFSEFDQMQTVALSPLEDGRFRLVDGHQRSKIMGGGEVHALVANRTLTEKEHEKAFALLRTATGSIDWDALSSWDFDDLSDWGFDNDLLKGFNNDANNLKEMLRADDGESVDAEPQIDRAEELLEKWQVKTGDLWRIGDHRLICGDCTDKAVIDRLMNGEKAVICHTDPPYNVDYGASKNPRHKIRSIENDALSDEGWSAFVHAWGEIIKEYTTGDVYVWGASGQDGMRMRLWLIEMGLHWSATIVWKKQQLVLSPAKYQRMYEPCLYGWFGEKSSFRAGRKETEVWEVDRPLNSKEHPTMKPIELCEIPIRNSSEKGDIILDLFNGSGSTMIAAENLGRVYRGAELEPKYVSVSLERMATAFPHLEIERIE